MESKGRSFDASMTERQRACLYLLDLPERVLCQIEAVTDDEYRNTMIPTKEGTA